MTSGNHQIVKRAVLSEDGIYRYWLSRSWSPLPHATFVMLNPSMADAAVDDSTVRRCMGFAHDWGLGGVDIVNLYAFRSTKPADLWVAHDPVGPDNNGYLERAAASAHLLVAAWGAFAKPSRIAQVLKMPGFEHLTCLQTTQAGHPRHPLYVPKNRVPVPWPS